MPAKGVGNYIHVKTYTMLATRRVGFLFFFSRPTVWGEVGEGNFALPPTHAQLHGPARAFPLSFGDRGQKKFELFWHDLALLRGKSGQKSVSLGTDRFRLGRVA